jgi:hypothetical protein
MMMHLPIRALAGFAFCFSAAASAQSNGSGGLSWGETLCPGRIQVSTDNGDSIVRWSGAPIPRSGIELEGDFETLGARTVRGPDGNVAHIEVLESRLTLAQIQAYYRRCVIGPPSHVRKR